MIGRTGARIILLTAASSLLAASGYLLFLIAGPDDAGFGRRGAAGGASGPAAPTTVPVPPVTRLMEVDAKRAVDINTKVPFVVGGVEPAAPFLFEANPTDLGRATACLAAAAWYEAGDDAVGERAVVQVVLNRVRHPAFPKTVCGVVLQGSNRNTGCQFTFTCDGALRRTPSPQAWDRARAIAGAALAGMVYAPVGQATHYHTDWVVPYWASSLEKIAQQGTHLFYRWPGYYGRRNAFTGRYSGGELVEGRIAQLMGATPAELTAATVPETRPTVAALNPDRVEVSGVSAVDLRGSVVRLATDGKFAVRLDRSAFAGSYATTALKMCGDRAECEVWGWTNGAALPAALPPPASALPTLSFHFVRSGAEPTGVARWNCAEFPDRPKTRCL